MSDNNLVYILDGKIYINLTNKGIPGEKFLVEVEVSGTYTGTKKRSQTFGICTGKRWCKLY